jgi:hypothetical protein
MSIRNGESPQAVVPGPPAPATPFLNLLPGFLNPPPGPVPAVLVPLGPPSVPAPAPAPAPPPVPPPVPQSAEERAAAADAAQVKEENALLRLTLGIDSVDLGSARRLYKNAVKKGIRVPAFPVWVQVWYADLKASRAAKEAKLAVAKPDDPMLPQPEEDARLKRAASQLAESMEEAAQGDQPKRLKTADPGAEAGPEERTSEDNMQFFMTESDPALERYREEKKRIDAEKQAAKAEKAAERALKQAAKAEKQAAKAEKQAARAAESDAQRAASEENASRMAEETRRLMAEYDKSEKQIASARSQARKQRITVVEYLQKKKERQAEEEAPGPYDFLMTEYDLTKRQLNSKIKAAERSGLGVEAFLKAEKESREERFRAQETLQAFEEEQARLIRPQLELIKRITILLDITTGNDEREPVAKRADSLQEGMRLLNEQLLPAFKPVDKVKAWMEEFVQRIEDATQAADIKSLKGDLEMVKVKNAVVESVITKIEAIKVASFDNNQLNPLSHEEISARVKNMLIEARDLVIKLSKIPPLVESALVKRELKGQQQKSGDCISFRNELWKHWWHMENGLFTVWNSIRSILGEDEGDKFIQDNGLVEPLTNALQQALSVKNFFEAETWGNEVKDLDRTPAVSKRYYPLFLLIKSDQQKAYLEINQSSSENWGKCGPISEEDKALLFFEMERAITIFQEMRKQLDALQESNPTEYAKYYRYVLTNRWIADKKVKERMESMSEEAAAKKKALKKARMAEEKAAKLAQEALPNKDEDEDEDEDEDDEDFKSDERDEEVIPEEYDEGSGDSDDEGSGEEDDMEVGAAAQRGLGDAVHLQPETGALAFDFGDEDEEDGEEDDEEDDEESGEEDDEESGEEEEGEEEDVSSDEDAELTAEDLAKVGKEKLRDQRSAQMAKAEKVFEKTKRGRGDEDSDDEDAAAKDKKAFEELDSIKDIMRKGTNTADLDNYEKAEAKLAQGINDEKEVSDDAKVFAENGLDYARDEWAFELISNTKNMGYKELFAWMRENGIADANNVPSGKLFLEMTTKKGELKPKFKKMRIKAVARRGVLMADKKLAIGVSGNQGTKALSGRGMSMVDRIIALHLSK